MNGMNSYPVCRARRKMTGAVLVAAVAAALGGCAGGPDCLKPQRYDHASVFPQLKSPPGLKIPTPDEDMQIPDVSRGPVAAYDTAPQGTEADNPRSRCLTTPPPLNASG